MSEKTVNMRRSSGDVCLEMRYISLHRFLRIVSELLTSVSNIYKVAKVPAHPPGQEFNVTALERSS